MAQRAANMLPGMHDSAACSQSSPSRLCWGKFCFIRHSVVHRCMLGLVGGGRRKRLQNLSPTTLSCVFALHKHAAGRNCLDCAIIELVHGGGVRSDSTGGQCRHQSSSILSSAHLISWMASFERRVRPGTISLLRKLIHCTREAPCN